MGAVMEVGASNCQPNRKVCLSAAGGRVGPGLEVLGSAQGAVPTELGWGGLETGPGWAILPSVWRMRLAAQVLNP